MTSVSGIKLIERLLHSGDNHLTSLGGELASMIQQNSTTNGVALKITDGIRILGSPVGSPTFCKDFISKAMTKAQAHADTSLAKLDNKQSVLQLFKFCTAHKMTHLFSADVLAATKHPKNWNTWDSDLCSDFNAMISHMISALTNNSATPEHDILIASMSTKQGGLGIQHPRSTAIPAYFPTMKQNIQHATEGVWTCDHAPPIALPTHIKHMYQDWRSSSSYVFQPFQKYHAEFRDMCVSEVVPDRDTFFLLKSSVNRRKEEISSTASRQLKTMTAQIFLVDNDVQSLSQMEDLLEPRMASSLVDMSRLEPKNRRQNGEFTVMLKRKLRLPLWPKERCQCSCGKVRDVFGDHVLSCNKHCKTPMHNNIRNGFFTLMKKLCLKVKFTSSEVMVEKEPERVLPELPSLSPFDVAVTLDHMLNKQTWQTDLKMIGFDFTVISSTSKLGLTPSSQTSRNNLHLRLKEGDKKKFCRRGKTDKSNQITYSGEEICRLINNNNMTLTPAPVTPHGHTGPLFNRFLYGSDADPHPTFKNKPHAQECERIARSASVPHGVLPRANHLWRMNNPTTSHGGTHKAMDPQSHFNQDFGLIMSTAVSSHHLRAYNRISNLKSTPCSKNQHCRCNHDNSDCICAQPDCGNAPRFCADTGPLDQSQTLHANQHSTEMIPSQDTLSEHFSCGGGPLFDVILPANNRPHTCTYVAVGSN